MQTQSLIGYWQVRQAETHEWLPACVPGGIHTDLMACGKIPDPFVGTNEEQVQWVAEKNWEYRRFFYPNPAILKQERIWLTCDGLDTLAEVRLNGKILGQTDNMFRAWRWEVKELLLEGENRLEILFRSPVAYIRARERVRRLGGDMNMGIRGGPYVRKTPSHFGWDWGPRLPCMGIWQEIRLEGASLGKLGEVRFDQEHSQGMVTLTARIQCELWDRDNTRPDERYTLRLRITGPDRQVWLLDAPARQQSNMTVTIPNPQLWWPNGYGAQPLYGVVIELLDNEETILDTRDYRLGLRTIALRLTEDAALAGASVGATAGEEDNPAGAGSETIPKIPKKCFTFVINGLPIFCKGSNWIPVDSFPTRVTPERVEMLVRAAMQANHNMLRVWGGGYYESNHFYDVCDQYGILVWQDFQFACALYPLDDATYLDNVRCEVIEAARRLRHHASLAVWCGNNEIEWLGTRLGWFRKAPQKQAYETFFFHQLPELLASEDPQRPYWPGSPSSNDPFNQANSDQAGDAHLWEVYAAFRTPSFYRKQTPRFVSEFGFQALPEMRTIEKYGMSDGCKLDSPVMRCHQRALGGNSKLTWYLAQRFRLPRTLAGMVYLSQIFQAETIRTGVEHWRRHPEQTSGTLYWQINDCWPVISWSSIDYEGRWKALHYAARRFYAPVLLSIDDQVEKGQRKMDVWVSNDCGEAWQGRVHWTLETLEGKVIEGGDQPVRSAAHSAECLLKLNFARQNGKVDWKRTIFVAELWAGAERQALKIATFVPDLQMPLASTGIHSEIFETDGNAMIRVEAKSLARFVALSFDGADTLFGDNYFDLPAGREVTIAGSLPEGWTVEQARAALKVRSLVDFGPFDSIIASHWKGDQAFLRSVSEMVWMGLVKPALRR